MWPFENVLFTSVLLRWGTINKHITSVLQIRLYFFVLYNSVIHNYWQLAISARETEMTETWWSSLWRFVFHTGIMWQGISTYRSTTNLLLTTMPLWFLLQNFRCWPFHHQWLSLSALLFITINVQTARTYYAIFCAVHNFQWISNGQCRPCWHNALVKKHTKLCTSSHGSHTFPSTTVIVSIMQLNWQTTDIWLAHRACSQACYYHLCHSRQVQWLLDEYAVR